MNLHLVVMWSFLALFVSFGWKTTRGNSIEEMLPDLIGFIGAGGLFYVQMHGIIWP